MKIEPQNEQRLVPAVIPEKTLATFIFIWNILADSVRDLKGKLPVNSDKNHRNSIQNFLKMLKTLKNTLKMRKLYNYLYYYLQLLILLPIQLPILLIW